MESAEFWTIRGNDLFDQDKFGDSLIAYGLALKIDPRYKFALVGRGAALGALDMVLPELFAEFFLNSFFNNFNPHFIHYYWIPIKFAFTQ